MIKLDNVSKYYATDDAVAIGIRRVSLELNIGEFVAVTGESGSGKSTFLNVISGIDSYEEGEMIVNGEETSGYIQSDWEKFRNDYISFVFQEYNIIDSYTVLQNVEIALMNRFPDMAERRKQALELIEKVGLTSHIKHKGTKLSGGQKQRVVIARALAKDSPIIMADEPTGNLDSTTGKEIIELLAAMAKDRLIIVVTHNYDEIAPYATRKIRFFDGEIVEDKQIKNVDTTGSVQVTRLPKLPKKKQAENVFRIASNSLFSAPKKMVFLFALFICLTAVVLLGTSLFNMIDDLGDFKTKTFFNNDNSQRLIIKKEDNTVLSADDINKIEGIVGAENMCWDDLALDIQWDTEPKLTNSEYMPIFNAVICPMSSLNTEITKGRKPSADNEVIISTIYTIDSYYDNYLEQEYYLLPNIIIDNGDYRDQINSEEYSPSDAIKVVGFTQSEDVSRYAIYVSDALYDKIKYYTIAASVPFILDYTNELTLEESNKNIYVFLDSNVAAGEAKFIYKVNEANEVLLETDVSGNTDFKIETPFFDKTITLNVTEIESSTDLTLIGDMQNCEMYINPLDLYNAVYGGGYYQGSAFVDESKQSGIIKKLGDAGYSVVNAYAITNTQTMELLLFKILKYAYTIGFLLICYFMYRLGYMVSGKVIKSKNRDYVIMRSIGLEKKITNWVLTTELWLLSAMSMIFLAIPVTVYQIIYPLKDTIINSIDFGCFALATVSLFAISLFLSNKFSNTMFSDTIKNSLKNK